MRPGVAVERPPLLGGAGQPQLVGLAVHGDQAFGELGDHADGDTATAEVGA